jgi:hypothetical protein
VSAAILIFQDSNPEMLMSPRARANSPAMMILL